MNPIRIALAVALALACSPALATPIPAIGYALIAKDDPLRPGVPVRPIEITSTSGSKVYGRYIEGTKATSTNAAGTALVYRNAEQGPVWALVTRIRAAVAEEGWTKAQALDFARKGPDVPVYVAPPPPPPPPPPAKLGDPAVGIWTPCVGEGGGCKDAPARSTVRFGADTRWLVREATPPETLCSNGAFGGDPAPYVSKTCEWQAEQP